MAASASNTGTPSAAKSFAVSLLPMPIEPVRPMTKGSALAFTQNLFQRRAQCRRNLGLDAKEGFEGRRRLMHQHAQSVDGSVAGSSRISQQFCLQRIVDDVADRGGFRQ